MQAKTQGATTGVHHELAERGYALVDFPAGRAELVAAAERFLRFLVKPVPEKESWAHSYRISANARESQTGYVRRLREGDDDKEFFHYNAVFEEHFADRLATADPETDAFVASCRRLHHDALSCLRAALARLDPVVPGISGRFLRSGTPPRLTLRFVGYRTPAGGGPLARGHYDRSAWTLAIAESGPGLRGGRRPEELHDVAHHDGRALFFAGRQQSEFQPWWHEVVDVPGARRAEPTVRWAIVAFANELDRRTVATVEETNTPLPG